MSYSAVGLDGPIQYLNQAEQQASNNVDAACSKRPSFDEASYSYIIPILNKDCVKQILNVDDGHVLTYDDLSKLGEWWGKNAEKGADGADWQLIYGAFSSINNSPVGSLADLFGIVRTKLPTEDLSNAITGGFKGFADFLGFITNPENIVRLLAIAVGGFLIFRGWSGLGI